MKRLLLMCAAILTASFLHAGDTITVKAFTDGDYAAKRISGMRPINGTSEYHKTANKLLPILLKPGGRRV